MEFSMDDVAKEIKWRGIPAFVGMTGGGCATIMIGTRDDDDRYQLLAGPGRYSWTDHSIGDTDDFYCGLDDDGDSDPSLDFAKLTDDERAHPIGTIADFVVKTLRGD